MWKNNIIKWILKKQSVDVWNGFTWLKVGSCEHGNDPLGSIKAGNFFISRATDTFSRRALLHGVRKILSCNDDFCFLG
jgi:hypothetical protein